MQLLNTERGVVDKVILVHIANAVVDKYWALHPDRKHNLAEKEKRNFQSLTEAAYVQSREHICARYSWPTTHLSNARKILVTI